MANELKIGPNADVFKPVTQVLYDSVGSTAYVAAPTWTEILSVAVTPGELSDIVAQAHAVVVATVLDEVQLKLQIDGTDDQIMTVTGAAGAKTALSLATQKSNVAAAATTIKLFAMGTAQAGVALLSIVTATVKKA